MIYKVFFQKKADEVPVRENTDSIYVEAASEREVRKLLKNRNYNIEFIQPVEGAFLEYERNSENFKVLEL
jgi:DNA-dependent RNA polymerase auxiliary subunit epsilon